MDFRALVEETHNVYDGKVICPNPSHQDDTASCHIYGADRDDGGKGHAYCFGCGWHADAIEWLKVVKGLDFHAAREAAARRDLIPHLPQGQIEFRASAAPATPKVEAPPNVGKRDYARRIWAEAKPIAGTLAETYLRSRAIPRAPDSSTRFHPSLKMSDFGAFPAILYAATNADGEVMAVQASWLNANGTRDERHLKKKTYGSAKGCSVKFGGGQSSVIVAEGPETAMSAGIIYSTPAEAVLGSANLKNWLLPDGVVRIALAVDNDAKDDAASYKHFSELGTRLMDDGYIVGAWAPNAGAKDFNDMLCRNPNLRRPLPPPKNPPANIGAEGLDLHAELKALVAAGRMLAEDAKALFLNYLANRPQETA